MIIPSHNQEIMTLILHYHLLHSHKAESINQLLSVSYFLNLLVEQLICLIMPNNSLIFLIYNL